MKKTTTTNRSCLYLLALALLCPAQSHDVELYVCVDPNDNNNVRVVYQGCWTSFATLNLDSTTSGDGFGRATFDFANLNNNPFAIRVVPNTGGATTLPRLKQVAASPEITAIRNRLRRNSNAGFALAGTNQPPIGLELTDANPPEFNLYIPDDCLVGGALPPDPFECNVQGDYQLTGNSNDGDWEVGTGLGSSLSWNVATGTTQSFIARVFTADGVNIGACDQVTFTATACPAAQANGDPHFLRWGQKHHDSFHGECDLVLLASHYIDGEGRNTSVDAHVRTTIRKFYSYIRVAAIRIGDHIIEIDQSQITIDGISIGKNAMVNGTFPVFIQDSSLDRTIIVDRRREKEYLIRWGSTTEISVTITGIFINVNVRGGPELYESTGLLGKYGTGEMLDRQGKAMDPKDMTAYGMEWQVKHQEDGSGDPMLFQKVEGPQWPHSQCVMPYWVDPKKEKRKARHRNLRNRNRKELRLKAKKACAKATDYDLCVQDIVTTGEIGLATSFLKN